MNFTFICMKEDISDGIQSENGTIVSRYDYSPKEKGLIIWAVAVGTIVGTAPVNWAYVKYGAKWPFFIAGLVSIVSTLLVPLTAKLGVPFLLIVRFLQGLAYSADFAAIGLVCVRWAPLFETGLFLSFLTCFSAIGGVTTNAVTGMFCESSLGWRFSYYAHGAFCIFIFAMWIIFYNDDPQLHSYVSEKELEGIQKGKTKAHIERDSFVPYKAILKDKAILVIWFNAFVEMVSYIFLATYAPIYFRDVLKYGIETTGFLAAFAYVSILPIRLVMGFLSDKLLCLPERLKMLFFNSISVGLAGICFAAVGFLPPYLADWSVAMFIAVNCLMGFNPGAFYRCAMLTSRQYGHFILATIQFMKSVALIVCPLMVAVFVHDESDFEQWRWVFYLNGALLLLANLMFYFIATDKPAEFTHITRETYKEYKNKKHKVCEVGLSKPATMETRS